MWLGLGLATVLGLLVLLLWPGTQWWVEHVDGVKLNGEDALTGKDRQEVLDKARGRLTGVATGLLAAVAIYYTAANAASARRTAQAAQEGVAAALHSAEKNEGAQQRAHELIARGQLTDRFTAAVAQLGDSSPAVQLGGAHALAGLADDATRTLRQTCIDVLCAYLRLPYDPYPGSLSENEDAALTDARRAEHAQRIKTYRALREVRHTIIRLIRDHLRLPAGNIHSWQGHDFDFTDVVFDGGDFSNAHFSGGRVSFVRAVFSRWVDFRFAEFSGGRVDFGRAKFSGDRIDFKYTKFSGGQIDFWRTDFSGGQVDFGYAEFSGGQVVFGSASFSGGHIDFQYATGGAPSGLLRGGRVPAEVVLPEQWITSGALGG